MSSLYPITNAENGAGHEMAYSDSSICEAELRRRLAKVRGTVISLTSRLTTVDHVFVHSELMAHSLVTMLSMVAHPSKAA
jgi:hypothetical protein